METSRLMSGDIKVELAMDRLQILNCSFHPSSKIRYTVRLSGLDALSGPGKNRIFGRVDFGHSYITNIVPATKWGRWVVGRWNNIGYWPSYGHSLSGAVT